MYDKKECDLQPTGATREEHVVFSFKRCTLETWRQRAEVYNKAWEFLTAQQWSDKRFLS